VVRCKRSFQTAELESRIKAKVESGLHTKSSKVIRDARRFMDTHEDWIHEIKIARLREQLKAGVDQLDPGEAIAMESKAALGTLFKDIRG
jgi:antitoxin ParD1/3/4